MCFNNKFNEYFFRFKLNIYKYTICIACRFQFAFRKPHFNLLPVVYLHTESTREHLVQSGALAVLVEVLHTDDADLQHYCAAALSNMAVNERHRTMTVALGQHDVIKQLIRLLSVPKEKVRWFLLSLIFQGQLYIVIIILVLPPGVLSVKLCPPNAWHSRWRCR